MRRRVLVIILAIVLIICAAAAGLIWWQDRQKQQEKVFNQVIEQLLEQQQSFTGQIAVQGDISFTVSFDGSRSGETSLVDFKVSTSTLGETKPEGTFYTNSDKVYIKLTNTQEILSSLKNDPHSRAIKANLMPTASLVKSKWIEFESNSEAGCLNQVAKKSVDQLKIAYKQYPFLDYQGSSNDQGGKRYDFVINDQLDDFLNFLGVDSTDCKNLAMQQTDLSLWVAEESVKKIEIKTDKFQLNLTFNQATTEFKQPEITDTISFDDVKSKLAEIGVGAN